MPTRAAVCSLVNLLTSTRQTCADSPRSTAGCQTARSQVPSSLHRRIAARIRQQLISAAPDSGLALHIRGREKVDSKRDEGDGLCSLRRHEMKEFVVASMHLVIPSLDADDSFYRSHVAITPSCQCRTVPFNTRSRGHKWMNARRVRITASEADQWYTYEGDADAWKGKVERHFMFLNSNICSNFTHRNSRSCLNNSQESFK